MFIRRLSLYLSIGIASIGYNTAAHSIELLDVKENSAKESIFASIQNASNSPVFLTASGGSSIEIKEKTGSLFPCSEIQGKIMYFGKKPGTSDLSRKIDCGHSYTVKEDAQ